MNFKLFALLLISSLSFAQKDGIITWINTNAINLQPHNSKEYLDLKSDYLNTHFANATVYGFGEATHHNKEFFTVKSEFFKYLVLQQGVKWLILEESYGACYFLNEYLDGKEGDLKELLSNFKQHIWKTEEMHELFSWIKAYNVSKSDTEKIKLYGNDCMFNYGLVQLINTSLEKDAISLSQNEALVLNYFMQDIFSVDKESSKLKENIESVKTIITNIQHNKQSSKKLLTETGILSQFISFLEQPTQATRDQYMAKNVESVFSETQDKIFIWAHNEHIKKTTLFRENTPSMGNLLKQKLKNKYYAVGFEFGTGTLFSYDQKENKAQNVILETPIEKTNSALWYNSNPDAFFFDFKTATDNNSMKKILSQRNDYIVIGGYGLVLKYLKYNIASEKYIDMYDGLIYIKKISRSTSLY